MYRSNPALRPTNRPPPNHRSTPPPAQPAPVPGNLYCWSHGLRYHSGHQCKYPKPGHQAHATANNRLGGNKN
jgi:hypothetical protein